jgi:hypothetical protein
MQNHLPCIPVRAVVQVRPGQSEAFDLRIPDFSDDHPNPLQAATEWLWDKWGDMLSSQPPEDVDGTVVFYDLSDPGQSPKLLFPEQSGLVVPNWQLSPTPSPGTALEVVA